MPPSGRHSDRLLLVGVAIMLGGCATAPESLLRNLEEETRRATELMQEREQALAALRTEMAATRIAAAKQAAELQELRRIVTQLRQENGESQQALLDAKRTLDSRETELAALKIERDQLAQASAPSIMSDGRLGMLQDRVASLSQELAELKQSLTVVARRSTDSATGSEHERRETSGPPATAGDGVMHVLHVRGDDLDRRDPVWITVQPGESFWSLARKHKTSMQALQAVNGKVGDHLAVGEPLRLP